MTEQDANKSAFEQQLNARRNMEQIPHKVLVMSGKGGVGKTSVAVNLAYALSQLGYRAGLMDADLHGPNVPAMTGTEGIPVAMEEGKMKPVVSSAGVKVLSISAFLPDPDAAIIWRGPMKIGAIQQFMGDANWDETDVLVVDCPPGTGDEPLTVAQNLMGADGAIIVTSPQDVALLDSRKSVDFARKVNMPILGIVENMSGLYCPHCNELIDLFKRGGGERAAGDLGVPFLGAIPLSPRMVGAGDDGTPLVAVAPDDAAAQALTAIARSLHESWQHAESPEAGGEDRQAAAGDRCRIAITANTDGGAEAPIGGHFGRCPYYSIAVVEGERVVAWEVVPNPHADNHQPGAVPRFVKEQDADVVLAGGMGARAVALFEEFGIRVVTGASGTAGQALANYLAGALNGITPCAHGHDDHGDGGGCGHQH